MIKIVLDTNVIIDGFKDEYSYEKRIIDEVRAEKILCFANKQTIQENKLIMRRLVENAEYTSEIEDLISKIQPVINRRQVRFVEDSEDNKILESAVESQADYLITRDKDLLSIDEYQGVDIITPTQFWTRYQEESNDDWKNLAKSWFG